MHAISVRCLKRLSVDPPQKLSSIMSSFLTLYFDLSFLCLFLSHLKSINSLSILPTFFFHSLFLLYDTPYTFLPPRPPPICLACHLNISFLFPTHVNQIYPSLSQNIWDWLLLGESLEGWHNQMENAFLATPYVSLVSKPKYMLWREVLHMFVEASSTSLGLDYTICITFWQKAEEIIQVSSQATESSQYKAKNIQQSFVLERPR